MQEEQIREWLDDVIDNMKDREALSEFSNQISICNPVNWVHLSKGIEIAADLLGVPLKKELHGKGYKYKLSFTYKGVEVMQLVGEEDAGTD